MEMSKIYSMSDPLIVEEMRYVGKTDSTLNERLDYHIREARSGKKTHKCHWIMKLLNNNNLPVMTLIDIVPRKEWKFWEKHYIKLLKSFGAKLTNQTNGGEGVLGYVWTEKQRKAKSGKNHPMFGKHLTKETKKLLREAAKRENLSEETLKLMREVQLGKVSSRKGKTYEEIYGIEKANKLRKEKITQMIGKTWEEFFGIEKAREIRQNAIKRGKERIVKKFPNGYKRKQLNKAV